MDAKDLRVEPVHGDHHENSPRYAHEGPAANCQDKIKPFQEVGPTPVSKVDVHTVRPCAVIGPDRVLPQPTNAIYLKKPEPDGWDYNDGYKKLPDYSQKVEHHLPSSNISPRQTFQESMPRIIVPPSVKPSENSNNIYADKHNLNENIKYNMPSEPKYCDVPYIVSPVNNEQRSATRIPEPFAPQSNSPMMRSHGWPPAVGTSGRQAHPYGGSDLHRYPEYPNSSSRPIYFRQIHEETAHFADPYSRNGSMRYQPYPTSKEFGQNTRYEYNSNYPNSYHPPIFPSQPGSQKYVLQKSFAPGSPYNPYPQPHKYLEQRVPQEPPPDGYQRSPNQPPGFNLTYQGHSLLPNYSHNAGSCVPNKQYPYSESTIKSTMKAPYDNHNKIAIDYGSSQVKPYPVNDNMYNDGRPFPVKGPMMMHNYPSHNNISPYPPHHFRKENPILKGYEYVPHFSNMDPSVNVMSPYSRLPPPHYSPNMISPTDSNTSNDTYLSQDYGYVSQSSSGSGRSGDINGNKFPSHEMLRRFDYRYAPFNRSPTSRLDSKRARGDKKNIDVRQFLQMWSEGDDENNDSNAKEPTIHLPEPKHIPNTKEELYVLGLVNVSNDELKKYEHIQKVSKLPENIKGYNSLELLDQFEEVIGASNVCSVPPMASKSKREFRNSASEGPASPLDVEAKITQSIIHKEVGCNFEIKPCSPKMLNVEIATPALTIIGERTIEKVSNLHTAQETNKFSNRDNLETFTNVKQPEDINNIPSCKMIAPCTNDIENNIDKTDYTIHDLESSSGVCLASLPRLDTDIEFNFTEVNQQFIDANRESSAQNDLKLLQNKELNYKSKSDITPVLRNQDAEISCFKEDISKSVSPVLSTSYECDNNYLKLSKFRKSKTTPKEIVDTNFNIQSQRTNSVIIKNPDNIERHSSTINHKTTINMPKGATVKDVLHKEKSLPTPMNLSYQDLKLKNVDLPLNMNMQPESCIMREATKPEPNVAMDLCITNTSDVTCLHSDVTMNINKEYYLSTKTDQPAPSITNENCINKFEHAFDLSDSVLDTITNCELDAVTDVTSMNRSESTHNNMISDLDSHLDRPRKLKNIQDLTVEKLHESYANETDKPLKLLPPVGSISSSYSLESLVGNEVNKDMGFVKTNNFIDLNNDDGYLNKGKTKLELGRVSTKTGDHTSVITSSHSVDILISSTTNAIERFEEQESALQPVKEIYEKTNVNNSQLFDDIINPYNESDDFESYNKSDTFDDLEVNQSIEEISTFMKDFQDYKIAEKAKPNDLDCRSISSSTSSSSDSSTCTDELRESRLDSKNNIRSTSCSSSSSSSSDSSTSDVDELQESVVDHTNNEDSKSNMRNSGVNAAEIQGSLDHTNNRDSHSILSSSTICDSKACADEIGESVFDHTNKEVSKSISISSNMRDSGDGPEQQESLNHTIIRDGISLPRSSTISDSGVNGAELQKSLFDHINNKDSKLISISSNMSDSIADAPELQESINDKNNRDGNSLSNSPNICESKAYGTDELQESVLEYTNNADSKSITSNISVAGAAELQESLQINIINNGNSNLLSSLSTISDSGSDAAKLHESAIDHKNNEDVNKSIFTSSNSSAGAAKLQECLNPTNSKYSNPLPSSSTICDSKAFDVDKLQENITGYTNNGDNEFISISSKFCDSGAGADELQERLIYANNAESHSITSSSTTTDSGTDEPELRKGLFDHANKEDRRLIFIPSNMRDSGDGAVEQLESLNLPLNDTGVHKAELQISLFDHSNSGDSKLISVSSSMQDSSVGAAELQECINYTNNRDSKPSFSSVTSCDNSASGTEVLQGSFKVDENNVDSKPFTSLSSTSEKSPCGAEELQKSTLNHKNNIIDNSLNSCSSSSNISESSTCCTEELRDNLLDHDNNINSKSYISNICEPTTCSTEELRDNLLDHDNNIDSKSYISNICEPTTCSTEKLRETLVDHENNIDNKSGVSNICENITCSTEELRETLMCDENNIHSKLFTSNICERSTYSTEELRKTLVDHKTNMDSKSYMSNICENSTCSTVELRETLMCHENNVDSKSFTSKICEPSNYSAEDIRETVVDHKSNIDSKSFTSNISEPSTCSTEELRETLMDYENNVGTSLITTTEKSTCKELQETSLFNTNDLENNSFSCSSIICDKSASDHEKTLINNKNNLKTNLFYTLPGSKSYKENSENIFLLNNNEFDKNITNLENIQDIDILKDNLNKNIFPKHNVSDALNQIISYESDSDSQSFTNISSNCIKPSYYKCTFNKELYSSQMQNLILYELGYCKGLVSLNKCDKNINECKEDKLTQGEAINENIKLSSFNENCEITKKTLDNVSFSDTNNTKNECNDSNEIHSEYTSISVGHDYSVIDNQLKLTTENNLTIQNHITSNFTSTLDNIQTSIATKTMHRTLKRSLSDSSLCSGSGTYNNQNESSVKDRFAWCKRKKPNSIQDDEDCNNAVLYSRRNSTSVIQNDDLSFCIYISNDIIINEPDAEIFVSDICETENIQGIIIDDTENDLLEIKSIATEDNAETIEEPHNFVFETVEDNNESDVWLDDIACVETVVTDNVTEDSTESEVESQLILEDNLNLEHTIDDDSCEPFHLNMHSDKIKHIYGNTMGKADEDVVKSLYRTPHMNVNATLYEKDNSALQMFNEYDDNSCPELVLNENNAYVKSINTESNTQNDKVIIAKEMKPTKSLKEIFFVNPVDDSNTTMVSKGVAENNLTCRMQDIHSCDSSDNDLITDTRRKVGRNPSSSSPEVSSTTEDKKSGIFLKITNYNGSRVSVVETKFKQTSQVTETTKYFTSTDVNSKPLITKAAKKYIPPLRECHDFKIKLHLPCNKLLKLKELKIAKEQPKKGEKASNLKVCRSEFNKITIKKIKPKFEDVLKSLDKIGNPNKHKAKKPFKSGIPKVVIKKKENGSHYTSTADSEYNPDMSGRKWQPWVFLEKNIFIDNMLLRNKRKAVFCHRKNMYVLSNKLGRYSHGLGQRDNHVNPIHDKSSNDNYLSTLDTVVLKPLES